MQVLEQDKAMVREDLHIHAKGRELFHPFDKLLIWQIHIQDHREGSVYALSVHCCVEFGLPLSCVVSSELRSRKLSPNFPETSLRSESGNFLNFAMMWLAPACETAAGACLFGEKGGHKVGCIGTKG